MYFTHCNQRLLHRVLSSLQYILMLLLLTFFCSCNHSPHKGGPKTAIAPINEPASPVPAEEPPGNYIGFINQFDIPGNREIYIQLYFNEHTKSTQGIENALPENVDSTIYQDEENSRRRLPYPLAKKYLDIEGLSTLNIYNSRQQFLCHAKFVRVEYFEQSTSSEYIAVFLPEKSLKPGSYYAVNLVIDGFQANHLSGFHDQYLSNALLKKLQETPPYEQRVPNGRHFKISEKDTVLSIINSSQFTYVVLSAKKYSKVLYKSTDPENVEEVQAIALKGNQLPCLLMKNVQPDTDVYWDELLYFDGQAYSIAARQRLP